MAPHHKINSTHYCKQVETPLRSAAMLTAVPMYAMVNAQLRIDELTQSGLAFESVLLFMNIQLAYLMASCLSIHRL